MLRPDSLDARADLPPAFVCSYTKVGLDAAWVGRRRAGPVDDTEVGETLRDAESHVRLIALDLRDVTFIDSSGLHLIVDASTRARQVGRRLVLLRGSPNVDRLLALTGTTTVVEIAEVDPSQSPAQALRELADAGRAH